MVHIHRPDNHSDATLGIVQSVHDFPNRPRKLGPRAETMHQLSIIAAQHQPPVITVRVGPGRTKPLFGLPTENICLNTSGKRSGVLIVGGLFRCAPRERL